MFDSVDCNSLWRRKRADAKLSVDNLKFLQSSLNTLLNFKQRLYNICDAYGVYDTLT